MHESGWIGLKGFFDPAHHGGLKKIQHNPTHLINPTQSNLTHMGRVEPMGWTIFFITIIIKLSKKNININIYIFKKPKD